MKQDTILFNGCSITSGVGFNDGINDQHIYPNIICKKLNIKSINISESGNSNLNIFIDTAKQIVSDKASMFVVQWSALHRHWMYPSPNEKKFISTQNDDFVKEFQSYNHDYNNLLKVIDYTMILQSMAKNSNKKIFFINGLINWSDIKDDAIYKGILKDFNEDNQKEYINQLFNRMDDINFGLWMNPFNNILSEQKDNAPNDNHPGILTHSWIAEKLLNLINK